MTPMLKCNKCNKPSASASSRKWDGMFVDILCEDCFHAWLDEHGFKLPPKQTLPPVTNGTPGVAKVGQMDGNGSNSPKDPMTAGQRAEAKQPLKVDDYGKFTPPPFDHDFDNKSRCTTCHGEKDAQGWCDCTRDMQGTKQKEAMEAWTKMAGTAHLKPEFMPTVTKSLNNMYTIEVMHPLIRPGLKITTEASERYVAEVVAKIMSIVREINK